MLARSNLSGEAPMLLDIKLHEGLCHALCQPFAFSPSVSVKPPCGPAGFGQRPEVELVNGYQWI